MKTTKLIIMAAICFSSFGILAVNDGNALKYNDYAYLQHKDYKALNDFDKKYVDNYIDAYIEELGAVEAKKLSERLKLYNTTLSVYILKQFQKDFKEESYKRKLQMITKKIFEDEAQRARLVKEQEARIERFKAINEAKKQKNISSGCLEVSKKLFEKTADFEKLDERTQQYLKNIR